MTAAINSTGAGVCFFNDTATTEIYTLSLHDALPIFQHGCDPRVVVRVPERLTPGGPGLQEDRKSTRLNSSHSYISYAVFCLKKKKHRRRASRIGNRKTTASASANCAVCDDHVGLGDFRYLLNQSSVRCHANFASFFNDPATAEIYTLSLHAALPI